MLSLCEQSWVEHSEHDYADQALSVLDALQHVALRVNIVWSLCCMNLDFYQLTLSCYLVLTLNQSCQLAFSATSFPFLEAFPSLIAVLQTVCRPANLSSYHPVVCNVLGFGSPMVH